MGNRGWAKSAISVGGVLGKIEGGVDISAETGEARMASPCKREKAIWVERTMGRKAFIDIPIRLSPKLYVFEGICVFTDE